MTTENPFLKTLRGKLLVAEAKEATIDKILGVIGKDDELDTLFAVAGWLTTSAAQNQLEEAGVSQGGIQKLIIAVTPPPVVSAPTEPKKGEEGEEGVIERMLKHFFPGKKPEDMNEYELVAAWENPEFKKDPTKLALLRGEIQRKFGVEQIFAQRREQGPDGKPVKKYDSEATLKELTRRRTSNKPPRSDFDGGKFVSFDKLVDETTYARPFSNGRVDLDENGQDNARTKWPIKILASEKIPLRLVFSHAVDLSIRNPSQYGALAQIRPSTPREEVVFAAEIADNNQQVAAHLLGAWNEFLGLVEDRDRLISDAEQRAIWKSAPSHDPSDPLRGGAPRGGSQGGAGPFGDSTAVKIAVLCHEDDREGWQTMKKFFTPKVRNGTVVLVCNLEVLPGMNATEFASRMIRDAEIIMLMVSNNLGNDVDLMDLALLSLCKRDEGGAKVIPINYRVYSEKLWGHLQAIPTGKALYGRVDQDEALVEVVQGVGRVVETVIREKANRTATAPFSWTNALIRKMLRTVFPSDSQLDAFAQDHVPAAYGLFARGMDREAKNSLIIEQGGELEELAEKIKQAQPQRFAVFLQSL